MSGKVLAFVWSLIFSCLAVAAPPIPLLSDPLGQQDKVPEELPVPEPAALDVGWWRYFAVEGPKLEERVSKLANRLQELRAELPPKTLEAADSYLKLIQANLQAFPQVRAQPNPELPVPVVYAERYSLAKTLEIVKLQRETRAELGSMREDITAINKAISSLQRRVDTELAAYLGLAETDPARVIAGLQIMAERLELALAEERQRVREATVKAREAKLRQLEEELAAARERLVAEYNDLSRLSNEIEQARQELDKARERALKEQTAALNIVADDPDERATALYREQRVTRALVGETLVQIRMIRLQGERHLAALLLGTVSVDTDALRQQLGQWRNDLAAAATQNQNWIAESERERGRTGAAMAQDGEGGSEEAPVFLQLINQDRFTLAQETLVAAQRLQDDLMQAEFVINLLAEQLLLKEGRLQDWLARGQFWMEQLWDFARGSLTTSLFRLGETPVTALGLLRIALILTIAWLISYWLRRVMNQLGELRDGAHISAYYTIGRLSHYLIITIGLMLGLSSIGMDFTNFALVAGALAIGIGFGLQAIVNNFISGLILLFERSLKVGDFVELASGVEGEVREINVRSTVINTNDNVDIVVPNSEFMNTNVVNWTLVENYRRIHLPFKVAYGSDKERVRQAGLEAAEKVPHTLTGIPGKNPGVWLVGFGDSCLSFELVVWITPRAVKRPGAVKAAYMWEIESALRKYSVEIPYPQRDLHLRSGFEQLLRGSQQTANPPLELKKQLETLSGR